MKKDIAKMVGFENILAAMAIIAITIVVTKVMVEAPAKDVFLLVQLCEKDNDQIKNCGQMRPLLVPDLNETKLMISTIGKPLAEILSIHYLKQGNIVLEIKTKAKKTSEGYSFAAQDLKVGNKIKLVGGKQDIVGNILSFSEDQNEIKIEEITATIKILYSRAISDANQLIGLTQKDSNGKTIATIEEIELKKDRTIAKIKIFAFKIKGAIVFNGNTIGKGTVLSIVGADNQFGGTVLEISEREN